MKSIALRLGCVVLGLQCTLAFGQDADGATRVQRDADNPLRMIIEAGKLKPRKGVEPEPPTKPVVEVKAAAPRPAPAKAAAAAPAPPQLGTLPEVAAPAVAPVSAEAPPAADMVALVRPAPAEPESYNADDYFGVPPPLKGGRASPARRAPAGPPEPQAAAAASPRAALQLADYVEPVLPERVRRRLQSDGEVVLGFTVNPDGSVGDLVVRSASDKALEPVAIDAVRQWRYQPIAAAQAHAVQLVFKHE